jgi:hypothetical protein
VSERAVVFVVDDDPSMRRSLEAQLRSTTMKARDKARPSTTQSGHEMREVELKPGQENELAAASERFATPLRTASVETGPRESRSARFSGGELGICEITVNVHEAL